MMIYDYDPERAVTLFPYDHDYNPARIMQAIQRGEELTYIHIQTGMREVYKIEAATGETFIPSYDQNGIVMSLLYMVWNAICERGYRMEKLETGVIRFRMDYPDWYAQPMPYKPIEMI
jgi:hypothetical protein